MVGVRATIPAEVARGEEGRALLSARQEMWLTSQSAAGEGYDRRRKIKD